MIVKKTHVLIFLLLFTSGVNLHGQHTSLDSIRNVFFELTFNSQQAPEFYQYLSCLEDPSPVIIAYRGAIEAILTKHKWNPFDKINCLNKSEQSFNEAIVLNPQDVEVRFIRYSVEQHIPRILGFSKHIKEDEVFIANRLEHMKSIDISLEMKKYIVHFLMEKSKLPQEQLSRLREALH
jgi:hypothetical protein